MPLCRCLESGYPDEYAVYERLEVESVIAVPVKPRPVGFLVVRNPKRFTNDCRALRMMAYVVLNLINQKTVFEGARMAFSPDIIRSEFDILINMFGKQTVEQQRNESTGGAMSYNIPLLQRDLEKIMTRYIETEKKVSVYREGFGGKGICVIRHCLPA